MFDIASNDPHERLAVIVTLRRQIIAYHSALVQRACRLTSPVIIVRPRARARRSRARSSRRAERGKNRDDPSGP